MKFTINSKYEVNDVIKLKNMSQGKIIEVTMHLQDNYYSINYLVEFENKERKWIDERSIFSVVDK